MSAVTFEEIPFPKSFLGSCQSIRQKLSRALFNVPQSKCL